MIHDPSAATSDLHAAADDDYASPWKCPSVAGLVLSTSTSFPHQKGVFADADPSTPIRY